MGNTHPHFDNGRHHQTGQIKKDQQTYGVMEESSVSNEPTVEMLKLENEQLKQRLDVEEVKNRQKQRIPSELESVLSLYEELPKFKDKLDETKRKIPLENHREIEDLKRENSRLYAALKLVNPNVKIRLEKQRELKELQANLGENEGLTLQEVDDRLDAIQRKMNEVTTIFADRMELAINSMYEALNESKKELRSVEEECSRKNHDPLIYKTIKNILLEQRDHLKSEMVNLNLTNKQQVLSNDSSSVILNNLATNVNVNKPNQDTEKTLNIKPDGGDSIIKNESDETSQCKITIFYLPEDGNDMKNVRLMLGYLTNLPLDKINAYRLGKVGSKGPRPTIVEFERSAYAQEILKNRYSLKDTEFKGVKIVRYDSERRQVSSKTSNTDNKIRSCENPSDTAHLTEEDDNDKSSEDKPYKIVLRYVQENGNDREKAVGILSKLTQLPLHDIHVERIGVKSDVKIRPMIVSFDSQEYVLDAMKNRYSLKDTQYRGVKVVKYEKPAHLTDFPF